MVKGSFVLSAHLPKTQAQKRQIAFRDTKIRYLVIVLAIFVIFVMEYCFDNPSALQTEIQHNYQIQEKEELSEATFNLLYALYSFPNILIPILGGALIDRVGARVVFVITAGICTLGQLVFSAGGFQNIFWLMLLGRIIFGVGGEVLQGSQSTIISNWFKPHELSLVLGICLSFPKMGSALNNYLTPIIAAHFDGQEYQQYYNVGVPLFVGFLAMALGFIASIILSLIDRRSQLKERIIHQSALLASQNKNTPKTLGKKLKSQLTDDNRYQSPSVRMEESSIVQESQYTHSLDDHEHAQIIKLSDIKALSGSYWLLILVATLTQSLFIPFLDNGNKYYQEVFIGVNNSEDAGIYLVVPYVLGALLVPIFALSFQKIQKRSYLIIATCLIFFFTYAFMFFAQTSISLRQTEWVRWIPVSLLGISIAMFSTVVIPTMPMIVNPRLLGTAFGLMEVMQNIAIGVFPLIIGELRHNEELNELQGFHLETIFLFLISCLCLGCSFILKAVDSTTGSRIDTKDFRKKYIQEVLKEDKQY